MPKDTKGASGPNKGMPIGSSGEGVLPYRMDGERSVRVRKPAAPTKESILARLKGGSGKFGLKPGNPNDIQDRRVKTTPPQFRRGMGGAKTSRYRDDIWMDKRKP